MDLAWRVQISHSIRVPRSDPRFAVTDSCSRAVEASKNRSPGWCIAMGAGRRDGRAQPGLYCRSDGPGEAARRGPLPSSPAARPGEQSSETMPRCTGSPLAPRSHTYVSKPSPSQDADLRCYVLGRAIREGHSQCAVPIAGHGCLRALETSESSHRAKSWPTKAATAMASNFARRRS